MMNLIALSLLTTSLAVAGFFSPNPQKNYYGGDQKQQVIVKEGRRAVVVEYGDDATGDGNTKVSISGPNPVEEQLSQAAASVAGVAQDAKRKAKEVVSAHYGAHGASPRELICDAYGKCKHKIADAWSKAKEKAAEAEEEVKEVVGGAVDKAKDLASKATQMAEDEAEDAKEKVKQVDEAAKAKAGEKVEKVKGKLEEVVEETEEKMKHEERKAKKELSDVVRRGKEVVFDAIRYLFRAMGSLMGIIHILGFAMAYGISVWVTFIMSHVLARALPRQQFGTVQSKMYPVYFQAMVSSMGVALLGHCLGHKTRHKADMLQAYNLMGSVLSVLANLLFLEPKATKVMFQRMKLEKEEGRGRAGTRVIDMGVTDAAGPTSSNAATTAAAAAVETPPREEQDEVKFKMNKLDERLKKLNAYSSLLNITTLMGLTWHLVYLSQRLAADSS